MLDTIEKQLADNNPPEVRETFDRLIDSGYAREETLRLIACALISEVFSVLKNNSPYDNNRYVANLKRLPTLPWEKS